MNKCQSIKSYSASNFNSPFETLYCKFAGKFHKNQCKVWRISSFAWTGFCANDLDIKSYLNRFNKVGKYF